MKAEKSRRLRALLTLAAAGAVLATGCSSVRSVYVRPGYAPQAPSAVKRIAVAAWAPPGQPGLAETLDRVGADLVSLRRNYLVHASRPLHGGWEAACGDLEGVLVVQVLDVRVEPDAVRLDLAAELYRCGDGAMLWRAEASAGVDPSDEDLRELAASYATQLGDEARRWAAPCFVIMQEIVEELPDPILTEEEEVEKIELSS